MYNKDHITYKNNEIVQATSHMNDPTNLDEGCLYLTVHQKINMNLDISKLLYLKVNEALLFHSFVKGSERAGFIIEEDREGSRTGNHNLKYNKHYHALIFLPQSWTETSCSLEDASWKISHQISCITEVGDVDCRPYELNTSLHDLLDYSSKCSRQDKYNGKKPNFSSAVYPYEMDRTHYQNKNMTKKMYEQKQRFDELLAKFYADPSQFFSARYFHDFGEEICDYIKRNPLNLNADAA